MRLLGRVHRAIEKPRLTVMVGEALGPDAQLGACSSSDGKVVKPVRRVLARAAGLARLSQAVGLVIGPAFGHLHLHVSVALHVQERAARRAALAWLIGI